VLLTPGYYSRFNHQSSTGEPAYRARLRHLTPKNITGIHTTITTAKVAIHPNTRSTTSAAITRTMNSSNSNRSNGPKKVLLSLVGIYLTPAIAYVYKFFNHFVVFLSISCSSDRLWRPHQSQTPCHKKSRTYYLVPPSLQRGQQIPASQAMNMATAALFARLSKHVPSTAPPTHSSSTLSPRILTASVPAPIAHPGTVPARPPGTAPTPPAAEPAAAPHAAPPAAPQLQPPSIFPARSFVPFSYSLSGSLG
jgi:hypothetical protein